MTIHTTLKIGSQALETSAANAPEVDVTIEQRTRTSDGSLDVTLRGRGPNLGAFENGLDADGTVSRWVPVGGTGDWRLYRTRLTERASASMDYDGWADGRAVFPSAERTAHGWTLEALMPDRAVLQRFAANCESNGVQLELLKVSETDDVGGTQQFGLTDLQAETLLNAFDRGYFTVPREANLEEVAEPLDVSHQALSERLRRGVGSLIENTLMDQWVGDDRLETPGADPGTDTGLAPRETTIERPIALSL